MDARFLAPKDIAAELRVSLATVYRVIGEMRPIGVGLSDRRALRVARVDFEAWVEKERRRWESD